MLCYGEVSTCPNQDPDNAKTGVKCCCNWVKMELNAAVIGLKLSNIIIHEIDLPIEKTKFWSDSMLTLQYIQDRSHHFKIYVVNRVTQILESTTAAD